MLTDILFCHNDVFVDGLKSYSSLKLPKIVDANFCSDGFGPLLEEMVQALCRHVSDDSPTVRRLCLRGLVQVLECSFFFFFSPGQRRRMFT